jgi:hypothetical protein
MRLHGADSTRHLRRHQTHVPTHSGPYDFQGLVAGDVRLPALVIGRQPDLAALGALKNESDAPGAHQREFRKGSAGVPQSLSAGRFWAPVRSYRFERAFKPKLKPARG